MEWQNIKVLYEAENYEIGKDLISDVFYEFGVQGIEIGEPMSFDALDYYHDEKLYLENEYFVAAYFPCNEYLEDKKKVFLELLEKVCNENDIIYKVVYSNINEEEWAESWKKYFVPEKITKKLVVKPTWQEYEAKQGEEIIDLDPGMAFGTGTHPTTYLCMNMIEKYVKPEYEVLDVGTGSGILMIAAKKLGATKVCGIDIDDVAVKVAKDNLVLNKIDEMDFEVYKGNLLDVLSDKKFDMVVSNILAEVIVILLDDIKKVIKKGGELILSGKINEKKDMVINKLTEIGIECIEIAKKDEWVAIVGRY